MQISFCELRAKEVVNVYNGKRLGNIIDMIIDTTCARVLGVVVPNSNAKFAIFKPSSDVFIPYNNIIKIGKDVILVDLSNINTQELSTSNPKKLRDKKSRYNDDATSDYDGYTANLSTNNTLKSNENNKQYTDNYPYNQPPN